MLVGLSTASPSAVWSVHAGSSVSSQHRASRGPSGAAFLGFASTLPEARGSGVGLALTDAAFDWAHEHGYPVMVDRLARDEPARLALLAAARASARTFLRLYRSIP